MKELALSKVYQLLEPGPVVLLTTARGGRDNVMTMSWHMMVEFTPPLVACVVSDADYSFAALRATKECVIAIPAVALAPKVVEIGNCSGRTVDKFEKFGLTRAPARRVAAPLVVDCFANLECKVVDTRLVNKYCLFMLEVVQAWTDPAQHDAKTIHHRGYGAFVVDGETIKLKSKSRSSRCRNSRATALHGRGGADDIARSHIRPAKLRPWRLAIVCVPAPCSRQEETDGREVPMGSVAARSAEARGFRVRPESRPRIRRRAAIGDSGGRVHRLDARRQARRQRRRDPRRAGSCSPSAISSPRRRASGSPAPTAVSPLAMRSPSIRKPASAWCRPSTGSTCRRWSSAVPARRSPAIR